MIKLEHVHKYYKVGDEQLHVLNDVTVRITQGEFVGIMGPSSSGKSTLINILGFLDSKYEGKYSFNDESVSNLSDNQISKVRNSTVGFVFQDFNLIEQATVEENVRLPLLYRGLTPRQTHSKVKQALEKVGLGDKLEKYPRHLSGGQKQRICLARIFATDPDLFVLDEPTAGMDKISRERFYHLLHHSCAHHGKAILMVTHEEEDLEHYVDKHIHLMRKEDSPWRCFSMVSCKEHSSQD